MHLFPKILNKKNGALSPPLNPFLDFHFLCLLLLGILKSAYRIICISKQGNNHIKQQYENNKLIE